MCKLLLSRGASLDALNSSDRDPEARARYYCELNNAALFADVRAAGGWQPYVDAPRKELLEFRKALPSLQRGPSNVPAHVERLFADLGVPDEVFRHVLAFWRSERDY